MTGPEPLQSPPGVDERGYWADRVWRPWIERVHLLAGSTVLEYGCGPGQISRALAPHAERYIGLDIDPGEIAAAKSQNVHEHATFEAHPPEEIVDVLRSHAGEVDIVLLYAVVEHLTTPERLAVLGAAREVARPDGVIVVVELPNRLTPLDQHSSFEPFITQLPDELALAYLHDARRPELRDLVLSRRDNSLPADEDAEALHALRRFGRGASFHEFELAWGGPVNDYVVATNWEPELITHREIHPGEVALARTIARLRPDLSPCWSREWLDLILTPDAPQRRAPSHRPWIGHMGPASRLATRAIDDVILMSSGEAVLHITLPEATRQIAVRVVDSQSRTTVRAEAPDRSRSEAEGLGHPNHPRTVVLDLPDWSDDLLVQLPAGGWITGVTYRGYGS